MQSKPRLLVFVSHYLPGFKAGGPPRSIANLVQALSRDFDFSVVTRDRDLGDGGPYLDTEFDRWLPLGEARVIYRTPKMQSLAQVARLLRETPHDVLYLNSVFDVRFTLLPLFARRFGQVPRTPIVIAPRGELAPSALALKRCRKTAYLRAMRAAGLLNDTIWMASSEHEADDVRRIVRAAPDDVMVAADLAAPLPNGACAAGDPPPRGASEPLRVVFLSRLSPMKNLDYALRFLSQVDVPVALDIVGPSADEAYFAQCQGLADALPEHVATRFLGAVRPEEVHTTLGRYDLLLLPTRGENFGHVILEALGAGTPVLISDRTLWRSSGDGACEALPLEQPDAFVASLRRRARAGSAEQAALRRRARDLAATFAADPHHVEASRALFRRAAEQGTRR